MARHQSLAALVLMAVLALAPSLALAAMACAPNCCPMSAELASGKLEDCGSSLANRACCDEAPTPLSSVAPIAHEIPNLHAVLPPAPPIAIDSPRLPRRSADAARALRTSPLRLSVVLLI